MADLRADAAAVVATGFVSVIAGIRSKKICQDRWLLNKNMICSSKNAADAGRASGKPRSHFQQRPELGVSRQV
jgi:hypothetical protein